MTRNLIFASAAAALTLTFGARVDAVSRGTTYLTFNRPVAIPGATLAPGTYIFEKVDTDGRSDLVRVLSRDRAHVYLTQFAEADARPASLSEGTTVVMGESHQGAPPQVEAWYPPDDENGYHFSYQEE